MKRRQKSLKLFCAFFSVFVIKNAYMTEKNTIFRYIKLFHNIKFYRISRHEHKSPMNKIWDERFPDIFAQICRNKNDSIVEHSFGANNHATISTIRTHKNMMISDRLMIFRGILLMPMHSRRGILYEGYFCCYGGNGAPRTTILE